MLSLVAICGYLGGPLWACIGAGIGYALHSIITIIVAGRLVGFPIGKYLAGIARPLLPCIPLFVAGVGIERLLTGTAMHKWWSSRCRSSAAPWSTSLALAARAPAVGELIRLGRERSVDEAAGLASEPSAV